MRRVPNIEHANGLLWRPGQVPAPAGFGPIDVARPSRMRKMGRDYDEHWKQNLYPGFARDMDWGYFNAASEDQWLALGERGLAGASYEILNMHPEDPVQRGRLPDWQARGFIVREAKNRQLASGIFDEVSLRLTTAWFFPIESRSRWCTTAASASRKTTHPTSATSWLPWRKVGRNGLWLRTAMY